jgi:hypothetical protein
MPNEFEKAIANLLKPKQSVGSNENIEKLTTLEEYTTMADSISAVTSAPSKLVNTAIVGYSEVG